MSLGPVMDDAFHTWLAKTQEDILEPELPIIVRQTACPARLQTA